MPTVLLATPEAERRPGPAGGTTTGSRRRNHDRLCGLGAAYVGTGGHLGAGVDDGELDPGVGPDHRVMEDHRLLDHRAGLNTTPRDRTDRTPSGHAARGG